MGSPIRILFVDDEESLRTLVKNQLVIEGYDVETADDGDTALEMIANSTYDLILLDIRMPRMNGIDVLQQLRRRNLSARVVMLTGVDDLSVAIEAVKNGANDYVTKPYDLSILLAAIQRVLAR